MLLNVILSEDEEEEESHEEEKRASVVRSVNSCESEQPEESAK